MTRKTYCALVLATLSAPTLADADEPTQPSYESVVIPASDAARAGTSSFQLSAPELRALPGAVDHELPEALRVEPGVTADALGQNHVRGNYADVRYWLDGVPLPSALSIITRVTASVPPVRMRTL